MGLESIEFDENKIHHIGFSQFSDVASNAKCRVSYLVVATVVSLPRQTGKTL